MMNGFDYIGEHRRIVHQLTPGTKSVKLITKCIVNHIFMNNIVFILSFTGSFTTRKEKTKNQGYQNPV
ncbi:hypothetical protein SAMN05192553_11421 [Cyclobacterium xiamenense]|uniref:Uncharacterized protein n=1 Tax=Cyclobacterium xiamenense TaxID=1297121 RepID=A0A1H7BQE6_9BACT|nr:hypothetical protein SAMN05192553_11421 [Cyclobacterium xiamenense]